MQSFRIFKRQKKTGNNKFPVFLSKKILIFSQRLLYEKGLTNSCVGFGNCCFGGCSMLVEKCNFDWF